jgi:hypothetical protein
VAPHEKSSKLSKVSDARNHAGAKSFSTAWLKFNSGSVDSARRFDKLYIPGLPAALQLRENQTGLRRGRALGYWTGCMIAPYDGSSNPDASDSCHMYKCVPAWRQAGCAKLSSF